jgi:hypothetical protein
MTFEDKFSWGAAGVISLLALLQMNGGESWTVFLLCLSAAMFVPPMWEYFESPHAMTLRVLAAIVLFVAAFSVREGRNEAREAFIRACLNYETREHCESARAWENSKEIQREYGEILDD